MRNSSGAILSGTVKIVPAYDLWICGTQVTDANKDNLSTITGVAAGTVSYNPSNKTLTLNGANMSTTGNTCCVLSKIEGMIIDVQGTNNLTGNGWSPIAYEDGNSGTIQGGGTLNLTNTHANDQALYIRDGSLTIKNCTVNAVGGNAGILGGTGNGTLTFEHATVKAFGANQGSIKNFKKLNLIDCWIAEPTGAAFDTIQKAVCDTAGVIVTDTVKIALPAKYDLWICGTQVTDANKGDLTVINGTNGCTVTGTVSYNPANTTLTLDGANITVGTAVVNAIQTKIQGLKINVINLNNISSNMLSPTIRVHMDAGVVVTGGGTLNVINSVNECAIYSTSAHVRFKECTLFVAGGKRGISGSGNNRSLTFENVTATVIGRGEGSIMSYKDITLVSSI